MKRYLIGSFLLASTLGQAQEVSVFGAGNLDAQNPYGLNSTEKHILKNQQTINNISSRVNDINSLIESINRRLEGIESTYEGDSQKLNSTVLKMNELMQKVETSSDLASKNSTDTAEIKSVSEQLLNMKEETDKEVKNSITALKNAVSKISNLVNKINSEYVSSSELQKNMNQFVTREEFEALKKAMGVKTTAIKPSVDVSANNSDTSSSTSSDDSVALDTAAQKSDYMEKAKDEFERKYYNGAIPKFEKLVDLNYKPAESNYYLGEMWYVRKKYDLAISHFKKSAMLYDKAAYMPTLLLHSAISFEKISDKENAKSFYATLIDLYPTSSEAKEAKDKLSKL